MKFISLGAATCIASIGLTSCAQIRVQQIKNAYGSKGREIRDETSGVRFYRPALHVWITPVPPSDKINTKTASVEVQETAKSGKKTKTTNTAASSTAPAAYDLRFEWLPDYSQEYLISWDAGLGSVSPSFTIANGWNLTGFDSSVDSKFSDNLSAVASLATAGNALTNTGAWKGPGLYRMRILDGGTLTLGRRILDLGPK